MILSSLTVLNDRYAIQQPLGEPGRFDISYLGWGIEEEKQVLIQEYFPMRLAQRAVDETTVAPASKEVEALFQAGLKYFIKESSMLGKIEHEHLMQSHAPVEAHGTAYRITSYEPGTTLAAALKKRGAVSEQAALTIMTSVLEALQAAHEQGLLHGGFRPEAIYLTKSRRSLLTGFQDAHVQLARKSGHPEDVVVPGLSAVEQYAADARQGPWTDVYAAAATLYRMVEGKVLPEATARLDDDPVPALVGEAERLSEGLRNILLHALALGPKHRLQSVEALREMLAHSADVAPPAYVQAAAPQEEAAETADDPVPPTSEMEPADPQEEAETVPPPAVSPVIPVPEGEPPEPEPASTAPPAASPEEEKTVPSPVLETADPAPAEKEREGEESAFESRIDRGPKRPRKKSGAGRKVAMALGALLLAGAIGGSALLFAGGGSSSQLAQYTHLRAEGDSLFGTADYAAARTRYTRALRMQPEGTTDSGYLEGRLQRIDQLQAALRDANYEKYMARADSLRSLGENLASQGREQRAKDFYARANEAYLAALKNHPSDSAAFARAQEMNRLLAGKPAPAGEAAAGEEARLDLEQMKEQLYARYRQRGDELLEAGAYAEARRKFREALDYRPGDAYAQQRLDSIRAMLGEAEQERQFERYHRRGDELFAQGKYELARREYVLALAVKPQNTAVEARIQEIDRRLGQAQRGRQEYQYFRAQGDAFFGQEQYEKAIARYEQALEYQPNDGYAQDRIAEARGRIAAAKEAERRARMMEDGIYTVVDTPPRLIGGLAALHDEVKYPEAAIRRGVEGRVTLQVVVDEQGKVAEAGVLKGIGDACDQEALRVVRQARFTPALVDGEPVPARHSVWIRFQIREQE